MEIDGVTAPPRRVQSSVGGSGPSPADGRAIRSNAREGRVELRGRVAIVTGASAGIGRSVARKLAADGATVVMVARTRDALEAAAKDVGVAWPLDVGELAALPRLVDEVVARFGRLDVLVNNAGVHHRGPVADQTADGLAQMVQVNLTAPIVLSRAALPHLPAGGAIVNVTSLAGRLPLRDSATYSATKAGLRFFTRALAEERPDLIVSCVSPGPVDTGFFADLAQVSDLTFSQPMSSADQVADAVIACLSRPSTEISLPASSGALTLLGYLSPGLVRILRPSMIRRGARNKAAYAARKAAEGRS
jgi:hypothetical protein